jgi:DNA-binding response OmpR family regulator
MIFHSRAFGFKGKSPDPFSNTVETHIMNLRKKIDGGRKKKLIYTVPGRGYMISSVG